jgi:predicted TPR repeat methyltransferase
MRGLRSRQLAKTVKLFSDVAAAVDTALVDVTVERVDDRYDLIVVTNVFPYLSDSELLLALSNVVQMLKPGGVLLHNEPRPLLANATLALGLPLIHSRSAVVATVEGGPSLYDAVWMHEAP